MTLDFWVKGNSTGIFPGPALRMGGGWNWELLMPRGSNLVKRSRPGTEKSRAAHMLLLALTQDPTEADYRMIGRRVGMESQSVRNIWYRWVLLPQRDKLMEELERARRYIATLERRPRIPLPPPGARY